MSAPTRQLSTIKNIEEKQTPLSYKCRSCGAPRSNFPKCGYCGLEFLVDDEKKAWVKHGV